MPKSRSSICVFRSFKNLLIIGLAVCCSLLTSSVFAQSPHTVVFAGNTSDFNAAELFSATSGNVNYYMTYDANNVYFGAFNTSGNFGATDNFTIYLDTDPQISTTSGTGTTAGQAYNGVTGTLPFSANYNIHAEQSYQEARSFGSTWASTISGITYFTSSTCREVAIPKSSIGNPNALYVSFWMGYTNGIFANAPGASLGNVSNPTVVNFFGGIGLFADDCNPLSTQDLAIVDLVTDALPNANEAVGRLLITSGSHTATNNFKVAAGGSIEVTGGTLNLANTSIDFGGATVGSGKGTQILFSSGTLTSASASSFNVNGELKVLGVANAFGNHWFVNNKLTLLPGGGTTIGSGASLDLRNGGYLNTNAPTYASGSTLAYNTGTTYVASTEWTAGAASGIGVPFNVNVASSVANSSLSFGTSNNYRRCTNNLVVSNFGASSFILSSVAGGDFQLAGTFTQNGTFTPNNRAVVFNGSAAQAVNGNWNGTGATNNFAYLIVANTTAGGVTLNANTVISASSGDVLQLTSTGRLNISNAVDLSFINNGGNILVSGGARTIRFNTSTATISFSGSKTVTGLSSGTLNLTTLTAGATINLSQGVNFGSSLSTIGANIILRINTGGFINTNAPIYATGSTLQYNTAATFGRGQEWSATSGAGYPHHVIISNAGTILNLGNGGAGTARQCAGDLTINDGCSLSMATTPMTADLSVLGNLTIGNGTSGSLILSSSAGGNLNVGGNVTLNTSAALTHNNRSITLNGSANQNITGWSSAFDLILNNANGATLASSLTVSNVLTLTSGSLTLGANNLTLSNSAVGAIAGTFSSTRMVVTNGAGQLIRAIATAGLPINYTWPIGESTGTLEYSPISLNFTTNSIARNVGFNVIDADHPQLNTSPAQTDYISRYWNISNSAAGTYTYTAAATHVAADVVGSAANVRMNTYDGGIWRHDIGSSSASNVLTSTTGLTNATGPLTTGSAITGRVNDGATYVWNQTGTANFTTAANWTPTRTTLRTNDILVFNNGATTTATNVPVQTIGQLLISGNTNVTFTTATASTLTISGGNGTDFSLATGSTLVLGATAGNSIVIAHSNAVVSTLIGTLTINANTAFTNGVNFTNSSAQVDGTINNFGAITSTSANLSFNSSSFYNHNFTTAPGTIPAATWNATSTCRMQGFTTGGGNNFAPNGLGQSFGHFIWNCAGQSQNARLNGVLTSIQGNFTVSATNSSELQLTNNTAYNLNIGGNMSVSGNTTRLFMAKGNGTYQAQVNVTGSFSQSNTSQFSMNSGDANTSSRLLVGGDFSLATGATIEQTSGGTNANLIEWNGSAAQNVSIVGALPIAGQQMNYRVNNNAGMNLTGTVPVNASSTFYRKAGAIAGGTITYNQTSGSLEYEHASSMTTGVEWPTANGPVNVTMNGSGIVSLSEPKTLIAAGIFTSNSGVLALGAHNLTLLNTAAGALVNATPSATNMIAAHGLGQLMRSLPASARDLNFFVGDLTGTAEYSGIRLNFSANSFAGRLVGIRVVDDTSSVLSLPYAPIDYLSRHWIVTLSSTTGTYSYTPSITYNVAGDVEGTENNLQVAAFPFSASSWNHYATTIVSPTLTKSGAVLTNTNFSLNNAIFSGRTPVKYWDGSISSSWTDASNWTPNGVPVATDNIDINGNAINPCVLGSSATVNHLTFSDGGNFTLGAAGSLTVDGNFTYSATANASFSCGSTLNLTNTTFNQNIPAIQFGHLNLGTGARTLASTGTIRICGDYTPTSGTLVRTGSTVEFNGTSAQAILTNATGFNNLIVSNATANVNSNANITIDTDMNVLANARLNKTGGTLTIGSGATAQVSGFLRNAATIATTGSLTFNSSGVYEHNFTTTAGAVPAATWSNGSTCRFIGYTSNTTAPAGLGQAFHHVEWNCPLQSGNLNLSGALTTVNGNFLMVASGANELRLSGGAAASLTIGGSLIQSGGNLNFKNGNNNQMTITIAGNFEQTGGYLDACAGNNGTTVVRLNGNFSRTGNGDLTTSGSNAANALFSFEGTSQTILQTSSGFLEYCDFDIANGSTTSLLSNFVLNTSGLTAYPVILDVLSGGTLNCSTFEISGATGVLTRARVNSGGIIRTAHANGLTASGLSGTVQTDNRTYSSGATYVYDGSVNQQTGNFWTITSTANTVANLTIANTASTVTLNSGVNANVSNALTFTAANTSTLDLGSLTLHVTNSATNAVVRTNLGHVNGTLRRSIIPSATNTYTFHIGTSTAYAPVTSNLTMGAGAGSISAKSTDGAHPQMATDGLSQTAICNRYWTMTNTGSTVTSASHQFAYVSADLLGGATSSSLTLARYASGWTLPTFSTGSNTITGTALNNTSSFGDFFAAASCSSYLASISTVGATSFCDGGSVVLNASSNIPGSTFAWSPSSGLSSATGASVTATPSTSAIYTVTATSPQNCVDTETISVTVYPMPTATIAGPSVSCQGSTVIVGFLGTPNATVSYRLNGGALQNASIDATGVGSMSFTLIATSNVELVSVATVNCTQTINQTITVTSLLVEADIVGATTICGGTSTNITFNGTPNAVVTYTINNGSNLTLTLDNAGTFILNTGTIFNNRTYQLVSVTNGNCTRALNQSVLVTVNAIPDATFIGGGNVCGGTVHNVQVSGSPNAIVQYTINNGAPQNVNLNGSGSATITTGTLNTNTTYLLVSATIGSCTELIGVDVTFTIIGNTYYQDNDGDGFGNDAVSQIACTPPMGYVSIPGDCVDTNPSLNPYTEWYGDEDGDGYGSFIYITQCTNPNLPGVVAIGGDCNDSDPLVHGGAAEICGNNMDDNCNGQIDEGCIVLSNDSIAFATNIQNYVITYPLCTNFTGTTSGALNSPQSSAYVGKDRWYKFQAVTQSMRVAVSTTTWNAAIQVCDQSYAPLAGAQSNVQPSSGNEILILNNLNIGQWYFVSVGGTNATDVGSFTICVQGFETSACNSSVVGQLDICSTFKPRWIGANTYTVQFTPVNPGMGGGTYTSPGTFSMAQTSLNLVPGQSYNVTVQGNFTNLVNGIGQVLPNVVTIASNVCTITFAPHNDMQVRASQRCQAPATLLRASFMRMDPFVCAATNYTYEFTPTSACSNFTGVGVPFTITGNSRILQLNFNGTTTSPLGQTITSQTYYIVRVRPNFGAGGSVQGVYGTPQIIFVGGTLMTEADEATNPQAAWSEDQLSEPTFEIYPNPSAGESIWLESLVIDGEVQMELYDQFGKLIETKQWIADHGFTMEWNFRSQLSSGLYHIQLKHGDEIYRKKYMVSKY